MEGVEEPDIGDRGNDARRKRDILAGTLRTDAAQEKEAIS